MTLVFVGTDFRDVPQSLLEAAERHADAVRHALSALTDIIDGVVVVATCSRAEVYVDTSDVPKALDRIITSLSEHLGESPEMIGQVFRVLTGPAVPRHLFAVTAGLESMVIGEAEIAGQIRSALAMSQYNAHANKTLNRLFQRAQRVSRKVWASTDIGRSGRSIIHTALALAEEHLGGHQPRSALVIGTGAYSRVIVAALKKRGLHSIRVFSRSGRAHEFAVSHNIEAITGEELLDVLAEVDFVISASGQHGYVLSPNDVRDSLARRHNTAALTLIDVALSPDIDPRVALLDECTLIALETLRQEIPQKHSESIREADIIIERAAAEFEVEEKAREMDPIVTALRSHINDRVEHELRSIRGGTDEFPDINLEKAGRRIANAILHTPSIRAKEYAVHGQQEEYLRAVNLLFGLEVHHRGAP
jgi:glutamyl-tRNA reductase